MPLIQWLTIDCCFDVHHVVVSCHTSKVCGGDANYSVLSVDSNLDISKHKKSMLEYRVVQDTTWISQGLHE